MKKHGLKQAKYEYIKKKNNEYQYIKKDLEEEKLELKEIVKKVSNNLKFPMFVKPANAGSSVGVNKAKTKEDLEKYIKEASKFDHKILIEEAIEGKEIECAILEGEEIIASCVGEIKSAEEFYSYHAKYQNKASKTQIPANIPENLANEIKKQAIKAFQAIDGKGLARVDFFLEKETNQIYINEINTMPGFTQISMYPKLLEASGIPYKELLTKIIEKGTLI